MSRPTSLAQLERRIRCVERAMAQKELELREIAEDEDTVDCFAARCEDEADTWAEARTMILIALGHGGGDE